MYLSMYNCIKILTWNSSIITMKNWVQFVTPLKNITEGDKKYKMYSALLYVALKHWTALSRDTY